MRHIFADTLPVQCVVLSIAAYLLPVSAAAQVYKCIDAAGKTAYQSLPCPESARSSELDIRLVSSMPNLTGNVSVAEAKQAILSYCISNMGKQGNSALKKIASEQPHKVQNFCGCVAESSLSDTRKVKEMLSNNDRAGFQQLGIKAGLSCASRLQ